MWRRAARTGMEPVAGVDNGVAEVAVGKEEITIAEVDIMEDIIKTEDIEEGTMIDDTMTVSYPAQV